MDSNNKIKKILFENNKTVFFIQTVIPFALPFVLAIPNTYIHDGIKALFIIIAACIDLYLIFQLNKQQKADTRINSDNQAARYAYSSIFELNERKRDYLVKISYKNNNSISQNISPYNIHDYISEICNSLKNVLSEITNINKEHMSVSFIYRYIGATKEDSEWRWIIGRELTMKTPLNAFVEIEDTVYYFLIHGKQTVVFCNNKSDLEKDNHYYMSARDKRHNKIGSIFAIKVMFSNNTQSLVEGILVISTYGKRFVEDNDCEKTNQLRRLFIDDIFPCYQRLLETELGMLYLRYIDNHNTPKNRQKKAILYR